MTAQVGVETGTLSNITSTRVDVAIGGHTAGTEDIIVTLTNGESDTLIDGIGFTDTRILFVTSTIHTGDLGGIAGADAICAARAAAGGLTGTFQAWIADGTTSPSTRTGQLTTVEFISTTGQTIAPNWVGLVDGSIDVGIDKDESGATVALGVRAWTNVDALGGGSLGSDHCSGWTSTSGSGRTGIVGNSTSFWTNNLSTFACSGTAHLYCIE